MYETTYQSVYVHLYANGQQAGHHCLQQKPPLGGIHCRELEQQTDRNRSRYIDTDLGYVLHLLYHIHMAHWVTNVSLICSVLGLASASGLHLEPSTRRLSVWDSVPKNAHTLLARLFWYIRSLQCQMYVPPFLEI